MGQVHLHRDGQVFGAWVDLRPAASVRCIRPGGSVEGDLCAAWRGQQLTGPEDGTIYHLVNAHWSLEQKTYTFVNLADPELNIPWPIPSSRTKRSLICIINAQDAKLHGAAHDGDRLQR